jgi:hypothetical protein
MPLLCRWSSATATSDRNRSFSSQISLSQGRHRIPPSPRHEGAYRDPFLPTRNLTAQLGSSRPRHREAFVPLARSPCAEALPSQGRPAPPLSPARHCREGCDGRQQGGQ